MASVNKVIIVGHLGKDPDARYMPSGDAVTNVTVATSESWKDKATGERKEQTEWHRVVFFRRLAEIVAEHLVKGSQVYIEGRIRTRKWQDKDGVERYTTEIEATDMKMLGKKPASEPGDAPAPSYGAPPPADPAGRKPSFDDMDDDIPF